MRSVASAKFWKLFHALPDDVRDLATKNFNLWIDNPRHPSLHFKPIVEPLWSVRIGANHRAVGKFMDDGVFLWVWIGTHGQYDKL